MMKYILAVIVLLVGISAKAETVWLVESYCRVEQETITSWRHFSSSNAEQLPEPGPTRYIYYSGNGKKKDAERILKEITKIEEKQIPYFRCEEPRIVEYTFIEKDRP